MARWDLSNAYGVVGYEIDCLMGCPLVALYMQPVRVYMDFLVFYSKLI